MSRLPQSRAVRPVTWGAKIEHWVMRQEASYRARDLGIALEALGHRLDRDPNGYAIVQPGVAIVARCPNLDAVEEWIRTERRARRPVVARWGKCPDCGGKGIIGWAEANRRGLAIQGARASGIDCPRCSGAGEIEMPLAPACAPAPACAHAPAPAREVPDPAP